MEIEKKYTVRCIPDGLERYPVKVIEQGYLCTEPVVRIRKSNEDYILTYKSRIGVDENAGRHAKVVNELEAPLTKDGYEHLKKKIDGSLIRKKRYVIPLESGLKAELDLFEGCLSGFSLVEVEFPEEQAAENFIPPAWFGKDVSLDERFTNRYLSMTGNIPVLL